jgi:signal transduction histidine kinase/ligand-binding sensor domain-containing protein
MIGASRTRERTRVAVARIRQASLRKRTPLTLVSVLVVAACCGPGAVAQTAPRERRMDHAAAGVPPSRDLRFTHLTTADGLSQNRVVGAFQDDKGFMWLATGEGLNRYDGHSFVVYKNDPRNPASLSDNGVGGAMFQDHQGFLWLAVYPGINKFDPRTERTTRYLHDAKNPASFGGHSVGCIAADRRGHLWFGTLDDGLDRFDPATETFTHYRNDSDGQYVGWVRRVIEDSRGQIWFVSDRGLFHLNEQTGQPTRATAALNFRTFDLFEDRSGRFWLLAMSPDASLIQYDPTTRQHVEYPLGPGAIVLDGSTFVDDGNGFWVPSSRGLFYFDRRAERVTRHFQHDPSDPTTVSNDNVTFAYRDRSGLLWVGTANAGVNILDFRQERFTRYTTRASDPVPLGPGDIKAMHVDPGVLWVGLFPRALERVDRRTGEIALFRAGAAGGLSRGQELNAILRDTRGYLWVAGWASGLDRYDERSRQFRHYGHDPSDPHSLMTNDLICLYEDRDGRLWVGQFGGVSRFDPATDRFTNYSLGPDDSSRLAYSVSAIHQDRSGTLWFGTWSGILSRYDDKKNTFVSHTPRQGEPHQLQGGSIAAIHEDKDGTLWVASGLGLYRFNRRDETFDRYTELDGLPSNDLTGILEDDGGGLWISSKKGISRFDPHARTFRNYDVSDGLPSNDFQRSCGARAPNGELLFCGPAGVVAFFPGRLREDASAPPVALTNLAILNRPVSIGPGTAFPRAIPYADSITLPYDAKVFSLEFAALSFANSEKNRYRFRLEGFDPGWNEVDSKHRLATYTNLDPGGYTFRVQGANSDGVWNQQGASLAIVITPPWYKANWFRASCLALFFTLVWAAYRYRVGQIRHAFEMSLEARVGERTRIARELHDTLLQSFQGLLLRFQMASFLLPERADEAKANLDTAIQQAAKAITEGRDAVQGLRTSAADRKDLATAIRTLGDELATDVSPQPPAFSVAVEGHARDLHPILRDEIFKTAAEALRNAFRHAQAARVEVEIRYDSDEFRLRVRDDGKGIDPKVLAAQGVAGHYGLPGMRERAVAIGGNLMVWSESGAGTEVELRLPASIVYTASARRPWWSRLLAGKTAANVGGDGL